MACSLQIIVVLKSTTGFASEKIVQNGCQESIAHKHNRMDICESLFDRCNKEGEAFFERKVIGGETWMHHFVFESKSRIWIENTLNRQRKRNSKLNLPKKK